MIALICMTVSLVLYFYCPGHITGAWWWMLIATVSQTLYAGGLHSKIKRLKIRLRDVDRGW